MRRFTTIIILLGLVVLTMVFGRFYLQQKINSVLSQQPASFNFSPTPSPTHVPIGEVTKEIFVPYWGLPATSDEVSEYNKLIYFGIAVNENGINREEQGYQSLSEFNTISEGKEKMLAIRMIDSETNFDLLKDKSAQKRIIDQSITLAKQHGFEGAILNLELSALPFESLIDQISDFNQDFYTQAKKNSLTYGITAYGDTFFRVRPFDIKEIAQKSDEIYIMAYDFHKAKGNPGPNFPLSGAETYGYDFGKMTETFLSFTTPEKITVVFGFYGYDWQVDEKNIAQGLAEPVTLKEAQKDFITTCSFLSCEWRREQNAGEIEVRYLDSDNKQHVVWFEDKESVKRKEEFLKRRGITNFAYWAFSYF